MMPGPSTRDVKEHIACEVSCSSCQLYGSTLMLIHRRTFPCMLSQQAFEIPEQQRAQPRTRARHKKALRPKDASYSESMIQDFKREEIPTELAKLYDMKGIIGIGTTSKVYLCKRRARSEAFACKVIDKRKLNIEIENKELLLTQLRKEIEILQQLSHPSIVGFEDVVETADKIFVVMELVQGETLACPHTS